MKNTMKRVLKLTGKCVSEIASFLITQSFCRAFQFTSYACYYWYNPDGTSEGAEKYMLENSEMMIKAGDAWFEKRSRKKEEV